MSTLLTIREGTNKKFRSTTLLETLEQINLTIDSVVWLYSWNLHVQFKGEILALCLSRSMYRNTIYGVVTFELQTI